MNGFKKKIFGGALLLGLSLSAGISGFVSRMREDASIGVSAAESTVYTLTPAKGSNNSYTGNCDITIGDITWNLTGNSTVIPWRIGGKSLTKVDRAVYSKTAMNQQVSRIELDVGAADSIAVNSLSLVVASNADFSTVVDTVTANFAASSTISFSPTSETSWAQGSFYKFLFNVSVSNSKNKYVEFKEARFLYSAPESSTSIGLANDAKNYIQVVGGTYALPASIQNATGSEGPLSFSSDNPSVATVDSTTGLITAVGVGDAQITISCEGLDSFVYPFHVLSAHKGTQDDPLTGSEAENIYQIANDTTNTYYVAGYVSKVVTSGYLIDDGSFGLYGMTVSSDYSSETIEVGTYLRGYGVLSASGNTVVINGGTIDFVNNPAMDSISITGDMTTTTYNSSAEAWDVSGLSVIAHYDDSHEEVYSGAVDWSFSPASPKAAGTNEATPTVTLDLTVTATVEGNLHSSKTVSATVNFDKVTALVISNQQTEFGVGSAFTLGSGTLKANYSSNAKTDLTLDDVTVYIGGVKIDPKTYVLSAEDNGKIVTLEYVEAGVTATLAEGYAIVVSQDIIASLSISEYGTNNKLPSESVLTSVVVDNVVTLNAKKNGGTHNPSYYEEWRLYQNGKTGNTVLTVQLPTVGYELKSVKFIYTVKSSGTLVLNSDTTTKLASGTEYECSGTSLELTVGNSGTATNGQVRITGVEIKYTYDAFGSWCKDFVSSYVCDPTGTNAPSVDDWDTRGIAFLNLPQTVIDYAKEITSNPLGNTVEQAFAKYDYIVAKYNTAETAIYDDFAGRVAANKIVLSATKQMIGNSSASSIALAASASLGFLALGSFFLIRKKNERN
ncbi:MAG: Ig-like domain-containing protein [Candidatus Enteromonas sp.]|nr:Ig-like domain-containing protein [Candidatus Enteromonas sp.]